MRKLKITIIRDLCIGAGTCLIHAPETFELDGQNIAILKNAEGNTVSEIVEAAKSCPTVAILVEDADTGEKLWPLKVS